MGSIRVVLGLASSLDLEVEQIDVKTAFLHVDLDKEIYMEQPEGFQSQSCTELKYPKQVMMDSNDVMCITDEVPDEEVSEKTDMNVAIRYRSVSSIKIYFGCGFTKMYPALDEKFMMGIKLARKVLKRKVPSQEFAEKKHLKGFWLVNSNNTQFGSKVVLKKEDIGSEQELKKNEDIGLTKKSNMPNNVT
nr:hypothetical protein [Tanacetum cinerariifolium]